ncbi:hypothetical protein J6590_008722, partial [Homalodisca vitripennis]
MICKTLKSDLLVKALTCDPYLKDCLIVRRQSHKQWCPLIVVEAGFTTACIISVITSAVSVGVLTDARVVSERKTSKQRKAAQQVKPRWSSFKSN